MKLIITGREGSRTFDWMEFALIRDNVQHYIESGEPTHRCAALHAIEQAVDRGHCTVSAARLRGEVLHAWCALAHVPLDEAALSLRTRAILTGSGDEPTARGTLPARVAGWRLPVLGPGKVSVIRAAERFVSAVLVLTQTAHDRDLLQIRRQGPPPRFVRKGQTRWDAAI